MNRRQGNLFDPMISSSDYASSAVTFYRGNSDTEAVRTGTSHVFVRNSSVDQLCGLNGDNFSWLMSAIDQGGWTPVRIRPAAISWFPSTD
jgi:hypothetical protein